MDTVATRAVAEFERRLAELNATADATARLLATLAPPVVIASGDRPARRRRRPTFRHAPVRRG